MAGSIVKDQTDLPVLILGSASPRRVQLLAAAGYNAEVMVPDIVEQALPGEAPDAYVVRNADLKARKVSELLSKRGLPRTGAVVLTADTVVALGARIFEKPRDEADAQSMLATLAGREHTVWTGVALMTVGANEDPSRVATDAFVVGTQVSFRPLSELEIKSYVATGEPLDKAGAYALQGRGAALVSRVDGSYTNVIGLPLAEVVERLVARHGLLPWS